MKTNQEIFTEVLKRGYILESEIRILRKRSNDAEKDVFNYDLLEQINDSCGIPVTIEQGSKGLLWLQKYARSRRSIFGEWERGIINNATAKDFVFRGFRNVAMYNCLPNYMPVYKVGDLTYTYYAGNILI